MNQLLSTLTPETIVLWGGAAIGAASAMVRLLGLITRITPADWDDQALTRVGRVIAGLQIVLDYLALNPTKDSARKGKG